MCGRFTIHAPPELIEELFDAEGALALPASVRSARAHLAPTDPVMIVRAPSAEEKRRVLEVARWGLAGAVKMINTRQETLFEKQAAAARTRRCLIPAEGFFEWKKFSGPGRAVIKQPHRIRMKDGSLFAMAGIFERTRSPEGEWVESCSILTTEPNALLATIHHRMPVIVARENWDLWLDPSIRTRAPLEHLFSPFPAEEMAAEPLGEEPKQIGFDF